MTLLQAPSDKKPTRRGSRVEQPSRKTDDVVRLSCHPNFQLPGLSTLAGLHAGISRTTNNRCCDHHPHFQEHCSCESGILQQQASRAEPISHFNRRALRHSQSTNCRSQAPVRATGSGVQGWLRQTPTLQRQENSSQKPSSAG